MKLSQAANLFYDSMTGVLAPKTIKWYENRLPSLVDFTHDAEIETITVALLRSWRASLVKRGQRYENHPTRPALDGGLSPFTIHTYIRAAKRFFRWLHDEGLLPENPAARLELPQLPDYKPRGISAEDRDKLLKACLYYPRDYAIVMFLSDTACRVGGLSGLKLTDLDLDRRRAVVWEKGRGGGNKKRTVYFGTKTKKALLDYLAERPNVPDCPYLFVGCRRGNWDRLHESGVYIVLKRAAQRAGVEHDFNPHSFRHGAIRGMLTNGLSLPEVSQIAGHSSTKVTGDIYGCFDEDHLAERHNQHSWLK